MNPYLLINIKQIYKPVAPNDINSTKSLMLKLSHRSQVICALAAAKMVLPIWKKYASKNKKLTTEQKEAPKRVIEIIEKWLIGKATKEEVNKAAVYAAKTAAAVNATKMALLVWEKLAVKNNKSTAAVYAAKAAVVVADVANVETPKKAKIVKKWLDGNARIEDAADAAAFAAYYASSAAAANDIADGAAYATSYAKWWFKCYPLIQKELQDKYDNLCKQIVENI